MKPAGGGARWPEPGALSARSCHGLPKASTCFGQAQPDSAGHSILVSRLAGSEPAAAPPSTGEKKKKKKRRKAKKADGEGAAKEEL